MANVSFKKGLLTNLPSTYAEGTFYVTTDERAIYLDVSDSARIRLGDFQEFADLEALQANTNPNTSALYYVTDINCLAKWNGTGYIQINPDTGATSIELIGSGNLITEVKYDPATRKLTLTKGATAATAAELSALDGRVETAESKITALEGASHTHTNKSVIDGVTSEKITNWDGAAEKAHEHENKTVLDGITDAKVADWDAEKGAKAAAQNAQNTADEKIASVTAGDASVTVAGTATAPTIAVKLDPATGNAIKLSEAGLKVEVGAAPEYSIVKDGNSGDFAAVYHLTKDGGNVGAAINIPKDMVVQSGAVVTDPEGQPAGTYIELVLQNVTDPLYINVGSLIEYVTSGSAVGDMIVVAVSDDHKVTATITDGTITKAKLDAGIQASLGKADSAVQPADLSDLEGKAHTHTNKTLLDTYTQTEADLADAVAKKHAHANAAELDKIATGDKAKWDAMEQNAKDYADSLVLTWGSF